MREEWLQSEYTTAYALRHRGIRCRNVGHLRTAYDIETSNGLKIDVKDSELRNGRWTVNLRRRGRKKDGVADFFVVCLRGLRGSNRRTPRTFVVLDANDYQKQSMLIWTIRSLIHKHAHECGAWQRIIDAEASAGKATVQKGAPA